MTASAAETTADTVAVFNAALSQTCRLLELLAAEISSLIEALRLTRAELDTFVETSP